MYKLRFKHNHNKPYRHWRQDGWWHALPIVMHATAWRRELLLYTSCRQGQPLQFRAKNPHSYVIITFNIVLFRKSTVLQSINFDNYRDLTAFCATNAKYTGSRVMQ